MNQKPFRHPGFIVSTFVVAVLLVFQFSDHATGVAGSGQDSEDVALKEMQTFIEAYRIVQKEFADTTRISANALIMGSIRGMLETLGDPHTRYLPVQEAKDLMMETEGEFGGIGIHIGLENNRLAVIAPVEGTPAWKGGVEAGDIIVKIDDKKSDTMSLDAAVLLLRGQPGTKLVITVERGGSADTIVIPLVREVIRVPSVRSTTYEELGYIRITQFTERTSDELDNALKSVTDKHVKGLILDLRDNPGGVLTGAIAVANRFIDSGVIVSIVSRDPRQTISYSATPTPTMTRLPLVILVNAYSASASEIVTGAVKDHERGIVIGIKTYGKGSVQTVEPLPDGSKIALTTARYLTPSGQWIHGLGIQPDTGMVVALPDLTDTDVRALKILNDSDIIRDFARKRSAYVQGDIDQLADIVKGTGIIISRETLEKRFVVELARRNDDKTYLLPHLDPQLKKAIDVLRAGLKLEPATRH